MQNTIDFIGNYLAITFTWQYDLNFAIMVFLTDLFYTPIRK